MEIKVENELMIAREKNRFNRLYPIRLNVMGNGRFGRVLNITVEEAITLVEDLKSAIAMEV